VNEQVLWYLLTKQFKSHSDFTLDTRFRLFCEILGKYWANFAV